MTANAREELQQELQHEEQEIRSGPRDVIVTRHLRNCSDSRQRRGRSTGSQKRSNGVNEERTEKTCHQSTRCSGRRWARAPRARGCQWDPDTHQRVADQPLVCARIPLTLPAGPSAAFGPAPAAASVRSVAPFRSGLFVCLCPPPQERRAMSSRIRNVPRQYSFLGDSPYEAQSNASWPPAPPVKRSQHRRLSRDGPGIGPRFISSNDERVVVLVAIP